MLSKAINILKLINDKGYEGYIVGGYVRDFLLNIKSDDIDITTNMPIEELSKYYYIPNDKIKHGSFTLIDKKDNSSFEITLFRKELSYLKQRHPSIVLVNSYKEDYVRRDFTINALAMAFNGDIIDYCNGRDDLSNKLIKTIRDAKEMFIEDPVRILRAIYFKNKLNLNYECDTYKKLIDNIEHLSAISNKRIIQELSKMTTNFSIYINELISTNAYKFIYNLEETILYIKENNINIKNIEELLSIHYYLDNELTSWEISTSSKKNIIKIIDKVKSNNLNRVLLESDIEEIESINTFNMLLGKKDNYKQMINRKNLLPINKISSIDFDFKDLNKYVSNSKIKEIKDLIINNILDNKVKNNKEDIIYLINRLI